LFQNTFSSTFFRERYRDLMEATDKIIGLRTKCSIVREKLGRLDETVDSKRIAERINRSIEQRKKAVLGERSGDNKCQLYPLASQLKLLVDSMEQVSFESKFRQLT
jgi:hypothetical protein